MIERFGATLILAGTSFIMCSLIGICAGVLSSAKQFQLTDKLITFIVLLGISIPSFFLGMMMILLFAVHLRWFPVSGMWPIYGARDLTALASHLTLPATALAVVATGVIARLSRSAMLEILDFIFSNLSIIVLIMFVKKNNYFLLIENIKDIDLKNIKIFDSTTLFIAESTKQNGRYMYHSMDATVGQTTNSLWLYAGTGDYERIGDASKGIQNLMLGIADPNYPNYSLF